MFYCAPYGGEIYSFRIRTDNLPQTLGHIQQSWATAFPGNPFSYSFLDEYFNRQYENEKKFGKLFTSFAALAIIIGCLGLFGLAAYTASQRIKEIGIRKVLGASVMDIMTMLSKDFLKLVVIAVIIATPVTWFAMNKWLEDFAYRTHITWWIFAIAGIAAHCSLPCHCQLPGNKSCNCQSCKVITNGIKYFNHVQKQFQNCLAQHHPKQSQQLHQHCRAGNRHGFRNPHCILCTGRIEV